MLYPPVNYWITMNHWDNSRIIVEVLLIYQLVHHIYKYILYSCTTKRMVETL